MPSLAPSFPILIIGAGISGLSLAVGLRHHGIPFRIYEANPRSHTTQGHRFRLSADSIAALKSLLSPNQSELFDRTCTRSKLAPRYVDAKELRFPEEVPAGDGGSMPVDRSWLRQLLMAGLEEGAVEYGKRFVRFEVSAPDSDAAGGVRAWFEDGTASPIGGFLVGADGLKSRVRAQLQPERRLLDLQRNMLWGRTPLTEELRRDLPEGLLTWLMVLDKARNRQLVVEPMEWEMDVRWESGGILGTMQDYVYFALCTEPTNERVQTAEEKRSYLMEMVGEWHPDVKRLLEGADHELSACVRVLSSKPDIGTCGDKHGGRALLVGDAAHPMSPMGGAGADTAIINAADICRSFTKGKGLEDILEVEERMRERAETKVLHSFQNGEIFWAGKKWFEYSEMQV